MTHWQQVLVGSVCEIVKGGVDPQRHPTEQFAHYSIPALDEGKGPAIEAGEEIKSQKTVIENWVVLVSKLNPRIPRVWLVDDEQAYRRICSPEFVPLKPNAERLDLAYLAFAMRFALADGQISGSTSAAAKSRERAKPNDLLRLTLPLPPLPEQRRIVDLLARAEGIVRLRREAEKKAAELIPALFLDMFGDPATNPKGWPVALLPDVLSRPFKNGLYLPKERYAPEGTVQGVEMVHMSDAFYGEVKRGGLRRVLADDRHISDYKLTRTDLLVARRSLNFDGAAKVCGIPDNDEPLLFESSFIRHTPDLGKVRETLNKW
jgi:type I restriction enzyme S subunit